MNIGNILKVADAIEKASVCNFNMASWVQVEDCGTSACIAGHCYIMQGGELSINTDSRDARILRYAEYSSVVPLARDFLGLTDDEAGKLFLPTDNANINTGDLDDITSEHAVRALRILAITGRVDWIAAMNLSEPDMPSLPSPLPAKRERV